MLGMNRLRMWCGLTFLGGAAVLTPIFAQSGDRPLHRMAEFFQNKKTGTPPAPAPLREDARRIVEVQIELAWLAEPFTFPFYLEAHADAHQLEIRGNVPSRAVREHALKVARLYSPLPIVDSMKENPALTVKHMRMSAGQLQSAVNTALAESMPRHVRNLQARCSADGRVAIAGTVASFEEKLAISQSLRRLHGCTSVTNSVQVAADPDGSIARGITRGPQADAKPAAKQEPFFPRLTSNANKSAKPIVVPGSTNPAANDGSPRTATAVPASRTKETPEPMLTIGLGQPVDPPQGAKTAPAQPVAQTRTTPDPVKTLARANPTQLKRRIEQACPMAKEVKISFSSATDVRIEVQAAKPEDGDQLAGAVLSLPDLEPYKVDLHITLPQK